MITKVKELTRTINGRTDIIYYVYYDSGRIVTYRNNMIMAKSVLFFILDSTTCETQYLEQCPGVFVKICKYY